MAEASVATATDITVATLYGMVAAIPRNLRRRTEWVMDQATFDCLAVLPDIQMLAAQQGGELSRMFDMPIQIKTGISGIVLMTYTFTFDAVNAKALHD